MGQQQLLLIILGVIIVGIAVAVGITMFKTNAVAANKDALINDMVQLAARAQQYYRRPTSLGGGNFSFNNLVYTARELKNPNGTYSANPSGQSFTITATGSEYGANGQNVVITMTVTPDSVQAPVVTNP
jgi:Tfp pilus assembly protein PilE